MKWFLGWYYDERLKCNIPKCMQAPNEARAVDQLALVTGCSILKIEEIQEP